ncbi:MAG: carbamoyltransferase HypF, partial [Chthoniobacterales bacterium]
EHQRLRVVIRGAVQGVGFRPFVYRLATELELVGWVSNTAQGVLLEAEGPPPALDHFLLRLAQDKPPRAVVQSSEATFLDPVSYGDFKIRDSVESGPNTALILPDIATCADCLAEILDANHRRFRYPFTNCTNCGPRFSIIEALPYDRANTSMRRFTMCGECEREYHDPLDRRFHAQPNACSRCGPQLQLWDTEGRVLASRDEALQQAVESVRAGKILALKGLGGFQLIVDARSAASVAVLRERKHREEKPFALMVPSVASARELCEMSQLEERLLQSPEAPIVLLSKQSAIGHQQSAIAPGNPYLGVMLPYTPPHHLLMRELGFAVVATSGNQSDEPICTDEHAALTRLRGIADLFLVHDRQIVRHMDDSIVRVMAGREMMLRRARGYAPLPIRQPSAIRHPPSKIVLALGAHLKNTVALRVGDNVFVSQHIGDLATAEAHAAFRKSAADLPHLYDAKPEVIACDLHPDYLSTKHAQELPAEKITVQHHWAHVVACMAENEVEPPALGVSWDGTGYGNDGTIWGGEFFLAQSDGSFARVAHLRTFPLPGGERAVREPRRSALGLLHAICGPEVWAQRDLLPSFTEKEWSLLRQMLEKNVQAPITSSVGRLFDAVACLAGLRDRASFEGQAAMELEFAADPAEREAYPFLLTETQPIVLDWGATVRALLQDKRNGTPAATISARFHNMLSESIVAVARLTGQSKVVLSGGCFQNRRLTEQTIARLREERMQPYWHQRIPPNDGGIALGQAVAVSWLPSSGER